MVNKFHYLALFVWCVNLSCTSVSGDAVMCEEEDEDTGVCLYEGWYYIIDNIETTEINIWCRWDELDGEPAFLCEWHVDPESYTIAFWQPYTFMVLAETDAERIERIALRADKHITGEVSKWYSACKNWLASASHGPTGYDIKTFSYSYNFTHDDCEDIKALYNAGFSHPVGVGILTGFKAINEPDNTAGGWFDSNTGEIVINVGRIEKYVEEAYKVHGLKLDKNEIIKEVVAHERVHLADWTDNSYWDWVEDNSLTVHHSPAGKDDWTYRRGRFIGERAGPFDPELVWSRMCLEDNVRYYFAGWGHHNEVRAGHCIVKVVTTGGR